MAIVSIRNPPIDQQAYDAVMAKVGVDADPPEGLITHAAGAVAGGWQIIDVWESREAMDRFLQERLGPVIREVMGDNAPMPDDQQATVYEVHHLVRG